MRRQMFSQWRASVPIFQRLAGDDVHGERLHRANLGTSRTTSVVFRVKRLEPQRAPYAQPSNVLGKNTSRGSPSRPASAERNEALSLSNGEVEGASQGDLILPVPFSLIFHVYSWRVEFTAPSLLDKMCHLFLQPLA